MTLLIHTGKSKVIGPVRRYSIRIVICTPPPSPRAPLRSRQHNHHLTLRLVHDQVPDRQPLDQIHLLRDRLVVLGEVPDGLLQLPEGPPVRLGISGAALLLGTVPEPVLVEDVPLEGTQDLPGAEDVSLAEL